ncbi:MAG: PIN domain-containing protein [Methanosarcinales archaeon]
MNLDLFNKDEIFSDSNIFIYSATNTGPFLNCENFLLKIKSGEIIGYVNPIIVEEVYHKLLILEVCDRYNKLPYEAVRFIKQNPHILSQTNKSKQVIDEILKYKGLKVLEIGYSTIIEAKKLFNILLGNDAIHAATCKIYGIYDIATNDSDFEKVDFLNIWKPG